MFQELYIKVNFSGQSQLEESSKWKLHRWELWTFAGQLVTEAELVPPLLEGVQAGAPHAAR